MSAEGARKLFVGGLADSVTEIDLRSVFEGAGFVVAHLALPRDRETGRLRGFAFVTLENEDDAKRALTELQGRDCAGRPLSLREFSQEPPKRTPGGERPKREEEPTVFLGKLPFEATQAQVEELFQSEGVGPVTRLTLPMGPDGRPRGFGFATLASADQVERAVAALNGAQFLGRQIVVSPAQPRGSGGRGAAPEGGVGPRRAPGGGVRRSEFSGEQPSFDPFEAGPSEPPFFPPAEGKGGVRRRDGGKKEKRERRKGGAAETSAGRTARKKRGGGGNWHRWESDED
jgi:RNA recognition motif-containing protein